MSYFSQLPFTNLGRRNPGLVEFETLLSLFPQAALLVESPANRIVFASPKAAELSLSSPSELTSKTLQELFPDLDTWALQELVYQNQGENPPLTLGLIQRNGRLLEVHLTVASLDPKGKWLLLILEEETQHQRQQEKVRAFNHFWTNMHSLVSAPLQPDLSAALQQALHASQLLTNASLLGIYLANNQSPGLHLRTGLGDLQLLPETLPAQDLAHLLKPHLWSPDQRTLASLHRVARSKNLTYLASAALGQAKAAVGLVVVGDAHEKPVHNLQALIESLANTITGILQQQTRMAALEEELEARKLSLAISRTLDQAVEEGFLILKPDLTISKINRVAEQIFGYENNEVVRQPIANLLIETGALRTALIEALHGQVTQNIENVRLYRRNGETFLARASSFPILDADAVQGVLVSIQDMTEQEQIREQTAQLEQHALLGEVTAVFAHEVRNPINNISLSLENMARGLPEDDPRHPSIDRMMQDCDRLEDLMKSVLSFSRPTDYKMDKLDLGQLVQYLLERLQPRMSKVNVKYHLQVEDGLPPILGNLRALEQVFNNLFNNAIQAMSETGGSLAIKIQSQRTPATSAANHGRMYVEVSVADTGPGIPPENLERIFQPFFTTNRNGTGLGLAIGKRIVTAHKGTITADSFPGGGTVFLVQIPAADQNPTEQ